MRLTSGVAQAAVVLLSGVALAGCTAGAARQEAPVAAVPAAAGTAAPEAPRTEAEVLAAAAADTAGARRLSGAEYRRLVFGNSLVRTIGGGGTMVVQVGRDGSQTLRLTNAAGQTGTDQGQQTIGADRVCSRWTRIDPGRETCFAYFQRNGSLVAVDLSGRFLPVSFELRRGASPTL